DPDLEGAEGVLVAEAPTVILSSFTAPQTHPGDSPRGQFVQNSRKKRALQRIVYPLRGAGLRILRRLERLAHGQGPPVRRLLPRRLGGPAHHCAARALSNRD